MKEWKEIKKDALRIFDYSLDLSFKNRGKEYEGWWYPSFLFHNLFICIHEKYKRDDSKSMTSLQYRRLPIWRRLVYWSSIAGYAGLYEVVAWAMRFMVEDITQDIYLDQKLGNSLIGMKLGEWSNRRKERWGFADYIKEIDIPPFLKKKVKPLYGRLCQYVHPSREHIEMEVTSGRIYQEYVEREFDKSSKRHIQTCDIVISLVLCHFPQIVECLPRYTGIAENFIQDLRKRGFNCTARICEERSEYCTDSHSYLSEK
ncbi:MAG: hypothetical protein ACFFFC_17730 [Candidatus Thorarchaeota archaeon]